MRRWPILVMAVSACDGRAAGGDAAMAKNYKKTLYFDQMFYKKLVLAGILYSCYAPIGATPVPVRSTGNRCTVRRGIDDSTIYRSTPVLHARD